MAADPSRNDAPAANAPPAGVARNLPMTRAEAEFRQDTRNLNRRERDRYSNFLWNMMRLDMGPRVTIEQLLGPDGDAPIGYGEEAGLNANVAYYQDKSNHTELIQVLKFFTAYLLQQARKEPNPSVQQYLLFKAVDLARMIVQYSPMAVHADAESLVFGTFIALGSEYPQRFRNYMHREEVIYNTMRRLQTVPHEIQIRLKLAQEMAAQTSYLDALVQYHFLLRVLVRRGGQSLRSRGYVTSKIGELFQAMAGFSNANLGDGRKLKSFVERFNRDFAERGHELPRFTAPSTSQVNRVRQAMLGEATRWFVRAAATPPLELRIRMRCAARAGENMNNLGRYGEAIRTLEEGYPLWRGMRESKSVLEEKSEYIRHISTAAIHLKQRQMVEWAAREGAEVNNKLAAILRAEKEREQAKAALLA